MVGTLTNQIPASTCLMLPASSVHKVNKVHKARKAHKACKVRMARKVRKAHMACTTCKAHKAHKVVGKISGFYVNDVFISIDLIGCGGDINQSDSCKQCA